MKYFVFLATLAMLILTCSNKPDYDLAITNVKIFDSKTKTVAINKTVLIKADTIAAIIDVDNSFSAKQTINGNNRLLTPGFIDTHVHLIGNYGVDADLPSDHLEDDGLKMIRDLTAYHYLNYGVTTIIDMGQPETWMDLTLNWQKNPEPHYPNLYINGGSIVSDEDRRQPSHHIEVMNPEDGRKKVRDYAAKGMKYMKLYSKLRKPDYEAMADEAKKQGIIINSHVDNNVVTIGEAMDYGVKNFEHFFTLTPSVLSYDDHWPLMNEKFGIKMNSSIDEFAAQMVFFFGYIKTKPEIEAKLFALFDKMASEGATLSSALNVLASASGQSDFFTSFEYFPIRNSPMVSYSEAQQKQLDDAYQTMTNYLKIAYDKGVSLRIGTDCRFGGRALLSELILLNKAGFSIEDVLQMATLNGYRAMDLDKNYGSIEVGKKADLLLFEKDPFDNVKNILSEKTVIKDGQVFMLKKSVGHELMQLMITVGPENGKNWFVNALSDDTYGELESSELRNTVKELIGGGKIAEAMTAHELYIEHFPNRTFTIDGTILTNVAYRLAREGKTALLAKFHEFNRINFPEAQKFLGLSVYMAIINKGITAGEVEFEKNRNNPEYKLDENEMNGVGYLFLQKDKTKEAIAVFKMNVSAFPESWNVYDSLGEAYLTDGNKMLAKKNYLKSLELNPENNYAIEALKKL
ncbi:amidohydrolase family protein [Ulvibacter antarcticus]|uniref:Amidohydrolase family protein n=1 Tax=Ulvibacter antarcticus TaxID=442714 RepID=A0A3L9Z1Y2_9FLAO|nr:amidohydrolase family protein [Ulvibacter antarcticus]RMA64368.1 amidohydrolase family protein [Ulvibacter antarcticus]